MKLLSRRQFLHLAAGAAALPAVSRGARAQAYPARPITMIVPYQAAGLFDACARILADHMRAVLSQSVVIENVGGANGSIAMGRVARAAPDGYTIGFGSGDQFVVNPAIYPLQYDVVKDFDPIMPVMNGPFLVVGKKALPAGNLKELIAWLKANHRTVAFAHNGSGGVLHLCGLALQRAADASWPFIPYRGAVPALQDVIGGRIDLMCPSPASSLEMARSGLIRPYAVTSTTRLLSAPDITVDEAGFADLHISSWGGIFAPKGTPKNVLGKLHASLVDALANPSVQQRFIDLGQEIFPRGQQTPEALAALQKTEIDKWWPIIRAANIRGE
jgi:tripartite-type tricarboxylate transporter receptor subunit TctC